MSIADPPVASLVPTHLDLPETDGKPVENAYQPLQSMLLTGCLTPVLDRFHTDGNYFIGADTGIYWRRTDNPLEGCKAPDWYYVPSVPRLLEGTYRRSYVLWEEYARPLIVIEYVSGDGSEERDETPRTGKFWVYERAIQSTFYAIHDPDAERMDVFELVRGRYQPLPRDASGRFRIPAMEVDLGHWQGDYRGHPFTWLRAWDWHGRLLPTLEEQAEFQHQRAEEERRARLVADERAAKLASRLRELGVDPDAV
jgi:Uma2 family endonuclease